MRPDRLRVLRPSWLGRPMLTASGRYRAARRVTGLTYQGDGYSIGRTAGVDAITLSEPIEQLGLITGIRAMHEIGLDNG